MLLMGQQVQIVFIYSTAQHSQDIDQWKIIKDHSLSYTYVLIFIIHQLAQALLNIQSFQTIMNLNPLHPNYLNQMSFQQKTPVKSPPKKQSKSISASRQVRTQYEEVNISSANNQPISKSLSAKFTLQNYLNSSNLHLTRQGFLIAYLRKNNSISGRSFILFPEGIIACCNVINRRLSGWVSICKKGQFYSLSHFFGGRFHGTQYTYDLKCGLTMQSVYQSGKLQTVKRGVADSQLSFQKCLKNKQLIALLHSTLNTSFFQKYYPKVESSLGNFYGCKSKGMPSGLGVIMTDHECFYGSFQYGLLSGEGVMIFPNGNSYIGEFEEGMMKGLGNFINYGTSIYKYNDTLISEKIFQSKLNITSLHDNEQLSTIFGPIVNFYEKLKLIYQNRRRQKVESQVDSFVNVEVEDVDDNEDAEKEEPSSSNYSPREDVISELLKTNSYKQTHTNIPNDQKDKKMENPKDTTPKSKGNTPKKENESKVKGKQDLQQNKTRKQKWLIKDHEWNEIIEQLGEQNVSKQDDFLNPQKERIPPDDSMQLRKNALNSRINNQNMMSITDHQPEAADQLQNHLIAKIMRKN